MSVKVMSLVWDNFKQGGSAKLTMLAMADWCNDQGGSLHPSVATVAKKICVSEKQARLILHDLISDGFLSVIGNQFGGNPGQSRQYILNIQKLVTSPVEVTPPVEVRDPSPVGSFTPPAHGSQSIIEPLRTTNKPKRKRLAICTIQEFIETCKQNGERNIPENDSVFDYAEKIGIQNEMLLVCWQEFVRSHRESEKKQKDWRSSFRNYVRKNYYKLWHVEADGSVKETPQYRALKKIGDLNV